MLDTISLWSDRIINLTDTPTDEALQTSLLSETIRVRIHNLTTTGPISIPVRIESAFNTSCVERLEEIVGSGIATKEEFRAMEKIHRILSL